ncbi:MarR family transcriptional regulator [Alteromonas sp. 345S023]|uniref:MarR family transcriptional regulator n=1 Tax=Alteromonas profundi TaxID=2696062 RepID=A0A7X5LP81_9ALTE|nr:MarR family transcriptional regulator [Alteromonas profundi]NDV93037.1 MarR family transcriptional regulator [Alteromonas profundi]
MAEKSAVETTRLLAHAVKKQLAIQLEVEAVGLVPMQVRVMKIIHRRSPCTALDIASFMHRDKAQITRLVNGLMEQGFVEKVPNPEDKRSQLLSLTTTGEKMQASLSALAIHAEQTMTQGIGENDMKTFFDVAHKMLDNLQQAESVGKGCADS